MSYVEERLLLKASHQRISISTASSAVVKVNTVNIIHENHVCPIPYQQ